MDAALIAILRERMEEHFPTTSESRDNYE